MSEVITGTVPRRTQCGRVVRRQRIYDYLYDPLHTVSSEADHVRSTLKAFTSTDRVRRVPVFGSMFSNLPHHPRYTVQLDPADPVPASIDRGWRGHVEQRRVALQQLAGIIPWPKREECDVTGVDCWKFFKRPLIPIAQQVRPDVIFALPKEDFVKHVKQQPTHLTVGVQTDYRENETQTDPYSPEYVIQPGTTQPELLQLAPLTWGRGLPAGLAEVEMIERARARQAWEASLPPLNDLSRLDQRRRMMEEMEAKDWAFREDEIQKLQETRHAVLKDLLRQRGVAQNEVTKERLNRIHSKRQKDKETRLHKVYHEYNRSLRKLEAKRRNMERILERRGMVRDHAYSLGYVPQTHRGTLTRSVRSNELKSHYSDTHEGLPELEAGLSASVLDSCVKRPKPKASSIIDVTKPLPVNRAVELMNKYKALKEEESKQTTKTSLRFLIHKEKPVPRPVTPKVEEPPEGEEEEELSVIHLQKLLRGRSVQCEMFKGKENHTELIQELRTVHALQEEEQELQRADKELVIALKKQRDEHRHKAAQEEASRARAVGAELEHLFDTLSKELIRLQEERRIHAFTTLAKRDRRLREAAESGRRQVEERRRQEEDEIFRHVVQVHQENVDLYLEDIILGTVDQTADQQAREEIRRTAKEVNDIAYAMEESRDVLQSEEMVSELVYSFLIPEIEKISFRKRVHSSKQRHLQTAQSIVHGTAEDSGKLPTSLGDSQLTCGSERAADRVFEEMVSQVEQDQRQEPEHRNQTE